MAPNACPVGIVLMTVQEVHCVHLLVDKIADWITQLNTLAVFLDLLLLLGKARKRQAQAAQATIRRVEFRPWAGNRHPHGRVGLLIGLGEDGARRHGPEFALVAESLRSPHL